MRIKNTVGIDDWIRHIENRQKAVHLADDLMIGIGHKSAIATNMERKTRYTYIMKIDNRKLKTVTKSFADSLKKYPLIYENQLLTLIKWKWKITNNFPKRQE